MSECINIGCQYYDDFFDDNCGGHNMENCIVEKHERLMRNVESAEATLKGAKITLEIFNRRHYSINATEQEP